MATTMLHFDSYHGNYTNSPYNCSWSLIQPLYEITSIGVVSIELVNTFNNIRSENQTNILTVLNGTTQFTITLNPKLYTDINTLLSDINAAFSTLNSSLGITFSLTTGAYPRVQVSATSFTPSLLYTTNLPYVLGFRQDLDTISTHSLSAGTNFNLAYDSVIFMNLIEPSSENNANSMVGSFKILLSVATGSIQYSSGQVTINQAVRTNPKQAISHIKINLVDRFGFSLPKENSLDYSFTLNFNRG